MGISRGCVPGAKVRDRFPDPEGVHPNPELVVEAFEPGCSVSPEGYNLVRVREPDGSTWVASTYDLVRVDGERW
jgi:hypothetical protein